MFVILTLSLDNLVNFWFCREGFLSRKKLSMNTSTFSILCDSCSYSGSWKIWWSGFQYRLLWGVVYRFLSSLFYELLSCFVHLLQRVCCSWRGTMICLRWFQHLSCLCYLLEWRLSSFLNYMSPWSMFHIANVYLPIRKIVGLQPWGCKHHWWCGVEIISEVLV